MHKKQHTAAVPNCEHHVRSSNSKNTHNQCDILQCQMEQWLDSLSNEEFFEGILSFPFSTNNKTSSTNPSLTVSSAFESTAQHQQEESQEFYLLCQMLKMQSPPPTPIHPRALWFQPASSPYSLSSRGGGGSALLTGNKREEEERVRWNRFVCPKLFQFLEKRITNSTTSSADIGSNGDIDELALSQLPPEIAAMLREPSGGTTTSSVGNNKKRRKNTRRKKQIAPTTYSNNNNGPSNGKQSNHKSYEVLARSFQSPWGDALTIGCTDEQIQADRDIMEGTQIQYGYQWSSTNISTIDSSRKKKRQNTPNCIGDSSGSGGSSRIPVCKFRPPTQTSSDQPRTSPKEIALHIIHIASRGKFLSMPPNNNDHETFWAPWFDPTKEWFSLPMYLASRFEAKMWSCFLQNQHDENGHHQYQLQQQIILDIAPRNIPRKTLEKCLLRSVSKSLRDTLFVEVCSGSSTSSGLKSRDLMLRRLLQLDSLNSSAKNVLDHFGYDGISNSLRQREGNDIIDDLKLISCIPLVEYGTVTDQFRLTVAKHLEDALSLEVEKELLVSIQMDQNTVSNSKTNDNNNNNKKRRSRKKKKKKQPNSKNLVLAAIDEHKGDTTTSQVSNDDDVLNESGSSSRHLLPYSLADPPSEEKNQNTIFVLSILNDVVNDVFNTLGFDTFEDCQDGWVRHDRSIQKSAESKEKIFVVKRPLNRKIEKSRVEASNLLNNSTSVQDESKSSTVNYEPQRNKETGRNFISPIDNNLPITMEPDSRLDYGHHQNHYFHPILTNQDSDDQLAMSSSPEHVPFDENIDNLFPLSSTFHLGDSFSEMNSWNHSGNLLSRIFPNVDIYDDDQIASSTAASIASSVLSSSADSDLSAEREISNLQSVIDNGLNFKASLANAAIEKEKEMAAIAELEITNDVEQTSTHLEPLVENTSISSTPVEGDSPLPESSVTPPPRLSPAFISLADVGDLRRQGALDNAGSNEGHASPKRTKPPIHITASLPSSPKTINRVSLTPSWSREDLRIPAMRSENVTRKIDDSLPNYRDAAMKSVRRAPSVASHDAVEFRTRKQKRLLESTKVVKSGSSLNLSSKEVIIDGHIHLNTCAQSESALDGHEDSSHWNVIPKSGYEETDHATKDGATTISSVPMYGDLDELAGLREERNGYRDMCLTLGSEVAKLNNILAIERGMSEGIYSSHNNSSMKYANPSSYDPEYMPPFYHSKDSDFRPVFGVAMSDAGLHHEVQASEDGTDIMQSSIAATDTSGLPRSENISSAGHVRVSTIVEPQAVSDIASIDHATVSYSTIRPPLRLNHLGAIGLENFQGLQSRLTTEINMYVSSLETKLRKQDTRRKRAIERLKFLVTALWPRAQVKLYGSHVTNLCTSSSDLDLVICLPAVHKNAPADTPGALEGRNAVNESNQKLLARKLKSESWIDPRSIKIIERTVVPVIKVSTKDTRARALHLDISFDSPQHHGLEAVNMVTDVIQTLPLVRPLVLVLKQFLLNRGLLTCYTGGISSYCLFLMTTRYLQEQPLPWIDSGSMLMGFLDFYGNAFDPRSTGISVASSRYFPLNRHCTQPLNVSEHTTMCPMNNRFGPLYRQHSLELSTESTTFIQNQHESNQQFTFDPIFVEDPLSAVNNVGRNSFRIFQVKRAFSVAHRALVASLEWDMDSADEGDFPLLDSLLQGECLFEKS